MASSIPPHRRATARGHLAISVPRSRMSTEATTVVRPITIMLNLERSDVDGNLPAKAQKIRNRGSGGFPSWRLGSHPLTHSMQCPKHRAMRDSVLVLHLCHGHPGFVVSGHQLLLFRSNGLSSRRSRSSRMRAHTATPNSVARAVALSPASSRRTTSAICSAVSRDDSR